MTPEFEEILDWGGSPQGQCVCGRIHYVANGMNMEDGELEGLEKHHAAEPTRYIPGDGDSVSLGQLGGGPTHIWGCQCGRLDKLEAFFWENRNMIIGYYKARQAKLAAAAATTAALLEGVK